MAAGESHSSDGPDHEQRNEARYRSLVHALSTFVWVADAAGEFAAPQTEWERYTGHGFDQHAGGGWLKHARCRSSTTTAPVREWVGAVTDIESSLDVDQMFEREWLRQAQAAAGLAFWDYDPVSGEGWWTAEVYQLYDAPIGTSYQELDEYIHAEDRPQVVAARQAMAMTGTLDATFRIIRPSGEIRWLRSKGAKVPSVKGTRIAGAVIDVTDQMVLQERLSAQTAELADANRDLLTANEELMQFSLAASHDLREPLREISVFADLLARRLHGTLDADSREYLEMCRVAVRRLSQLLDDLLVYSQSIRTNGVAAGPSRQAALEEAECNLATAIKEANAEIEASELPDVQVDFAALTQLFQNLLSNAIKYRAAEPPRIRVSAVREGWFWQFAVSDNGIGIDPEYSELIFGIFKRLHSRAEYEGTGIGLAICQKIVERSGGRIWVRSALGEGATFYFTLPAA
jgi:signal transduction histidine kinase